MATYEFKLPELGEGIHEGEIIKWHVQAGDTVEEDDVILEVQNDKAVVEIPSPVQGKVKEVVVSEGSVAVVGDTLITFELAGETQEKKEEVKDTPVTESVKHASKPDSVNEGSVKQANTMPRKAAQILATPSVRKLARQLHIDLSQIKGTGRHGQITREDLEQVQANQEKDLSREEVSSLKKAASPQPISEQTIREVEERIPFKGIRKVIAEAMSQSVYTAPHVTLMDQVDVTKLVAFRQQMKPIAEQKGVKLTYLPFIVKTLIAALRQFPILNATLDEEKQAIIIKHYYHIGIATDTEAGLLVPVIFDAERKNIWQIAEEIRDLASRGRAGELTPAELKGSTITITNIGSAGGMYFTPIINYPEVAILGVGKITKQPLVRDEEIVIGSVMGLSLSFDHRLIDGAVAQQFLNVVKKMLADPQLLMMEV